jgi:hypothetical protein
MVLALSGVDTNTVISHFVIWTSVSPLRYYNGSQRTQNNKQAPAGTTKDITLTIPETLVIIRKPGNATSRNATSQSIIKAP